jgi:hypothetical protein
VDTTSVIDENDDLIFTLYNGGVPGTGVGGARVQATHFSGTPNWNEELYDANASSPADVRANNVSQLSTPYYDAARETLYAAKTYTIDILGGIDFKNWAATGAVTIDQDTGVATFTGSGQITGRVVLSDWTNLMDVVSNIVGTDGTYEIIVTDSSGRPTTVSGSISAYDTFNQYKGDVIQAGPGTVTINVNRNTAPVTASTLNFNSYYWALYEITGIATQSPLVNRVKNGYGQVNTPISYDNDNYIYFGTWGGDRTYYRYDKGTGALVSPDNLQDDFYGAGATRFEDFLVFGSDSGNLYQVIVRQFSWAWFATDLSGEQPDVGAIRSTVVNDGTDLYFSSRGSGTVGYVWRMDGQDGKFYKRPLSGNSTSTPVISENDQVYVGWYVTGIYPGRGGVNTLPKGFVDDTTVADVYAGDPVQASPIVYSDTEELLDYVYFTTNADHSYDTPPAANHNGYCWAVDVSSGTPVPSQNPTWNPVTGGTYALQGFAASNDGHVIYGDDSNVLYIFP